MTHCRIVFILSLSALLLMAACAPEERTLCYSYRAVAADGWERHDAVTFTCDTVRQSGDYDFTVGLRTTSSYPFQNLWLLVSQHYTNPDTTVIDTLCCTLTDPTGRNHGHGVSLYEQLFPLKHVHMNVGQTVDIHVNHIMRRPILPGITDVGIIIKRKENSQ